MKNNLVGLIILLFISVSTFGQEVTTIFTDRPNTTDATGLIDPADLQIELGYFRDITANNAVSTAPNISVKYGLIEWVELRVLSNVKIDESLNPNISGLTPITFSPKFKIMEREGFFSKLSASTSFTFPNTGEKAFQNSKLNVGYRLLMENTLSSKFSWSHSIGEDWDDNNNATWTWSSSLGYALTDKLGAFTELWGTANNTSSPLYLDAGLGYIIFNTLCVDVMYGTGLNKDASDYYLSIGGAWKMNFKK